MKNKHAYLIIAHQNFYILERLLLLLDDSRNDIYLHIDKKQKHADVAFFKSLIKHANLFILDKRLDVRWGEVSQIQCELHLFETAAKTNSYSYYHLISGVDLPLKSQDEIHHFCELNAGKEFIGFQTTEWDKTRLQYIHLFTRKLRFRTLRSKYYDRLHAILWRIQGKLRCQRVGTQLGELKKGSNWVSLTDNCVRFLINKMKYINIRQSITRHFATIYPETTTIQRDPYEQLTGCEAPPIHIQSMT